MKDKALFSLFSGVALVVATLIGVALLNMPQAQSARAATGGSMACAAAKPTLEQGYGVAAAAGRCTTMN